MSSTTATRSTPTRSTPTRSDAEIRSARLAAIRSGIVLAFVGMGRTLKKTWRRLLPAYWAVAGLGLAWVGLAWPIPAATLALVAGIVVAIAAGWPAGTWSIRAYRTLVAAVLSGSVVATVAAGPDTMHAHATLSVFGPCLAAAVLGWPWWYHLRTWTATVEAVSDESLTARWIQRWQTEVIDEGVCAGTRIIAAHEPRPGVTDLVVRLKPGIKAKQILASGVDVEVALDLADGAVGWRRTGRAAKLGLVIVERSYIADGVKWRGATYAAGRCELAMYADGTPGHWVFYRKGFGTLNGLVVGSTGAGKSRALGVLITNLLIARWMVVIGDPQNGQSLPAWRTAVGEYHQGVEAVTLLLRRLYAEVMARSDLLSAAGVEVFDEDDPRVKALGLRKLAAIIDECQMALLSQDKELITLVEDLVAIVRKTGVLLIFATQIPQMKSLGGSIRIRDALVAGNAFIMRLSNRGSSTTVLPDDFAGDPFGMSKEIDGKTTAGMGYLRDAPQLGMVARVPMLDETKAAETAPRTPVEWQVDEIDPATPMPKLAKTAATGGGGNGAVAKLRSAFGMGGTRAVAVTEPEPTDTPSWVLACLRKAPASAQALADRPDCPVRDKQLYAVLDRLAGAGRIVKPTRRGDPYTLA